MRELLLWEGIKKEAYCPVHKLGRKSLQIVHFNPTFCDIIIQKEKKTKTRRILSWLYLF